MGEGEVSPVQFLLSVSLGWRLEDLPSLLWRFIYGFKRKDDAHADFHSRDGQGPWKFGERLGGRDKRLWQVFWHICDIRRANPQ